MENNATKKQQPENCGNTCRCRMWTNSNLPKPPRSGVQGPDSRRTTKPRVNKEKPGVNMDNSEGSKEKDMSVVAATEKFIVRSPRYPSPAIKFGQLHRVLLSYLLTKKQRLTLGYPVEQAGNPQQVIIFNTPSRLEKVHEEGIAPQNGIPCVRCGSEFFMKKDRYAIQDLCEYHFGKLIRVNASSKQYTCCGGGKNSKGCTQGQQHVWTGLANGFNGPFNDFVKTRPKYDADPDYGQGVYSIDTEMCFTTNGLELCKISVVAVNGNVVYNQYVVPENDVIDYNTRFSGVTAEDIHRKGTKTLKDVQQDLTKFIHQGTVLIGHGLENDLRVLRLMHSTVIDTAVVFPHPHGLPYRRSLKSLVSSFLRREIQIGTGGHDSFEDAKACMELMMWKVTEDFAPLLMCPSVLWM